jgi:hypothetical protein
MRIMRWLVVGLVAVVGTPGLLHALQTTAAAPTGFDQVNLLAGALAGLGATALIGILKKLEAAVDAKIVGALGNYTPILVTVLGFVLPKVATALHLASVPDATALASAPVATCVAILCRELFVLLKLNGSQPPAP